MNSQNIMVVEDEWIVSDQICSDLKDLGYMVCGTAYTGEEAIRKAEAERPDLILMDIVLKDEMDGIEAAERITSQFDIPVIYLTAYTNHGYVERAKQTNPFGYLVKPFIKNELYANIEMALHKHSADKSIKNYLDRLAKCFKGTIYAVMGAIELRGPYTAGHHQRVAERTCAIAGEMGLTGFPMEGLLLASYVYDIGLVNVPVEILQGFGQLTGLNLAMHQTYPQMSYDILKEIEFPWFIADIVLQHRECYDGSGFPKGIKGEDILIEARILAVADAIEDLTSRRAFRNAFPLEQALEDISSKSGSRYDPEVVDACLKLFREKGYMMKPGEVRTMPWSAEEIDILDAGCFANVMRDITDCKQAEEELLRAHKLESLGILAGGIAHDFNNLMTVILGNVELAMIGLPEGHGSYPLLKAALQSIGQTKDFTGRLITFSRGGFPVKHVSDVSGILRETVKKMVGETAIQAIFDIEKDLWPAEVDEVQIEQVFYSLTVNAVEAMSEGGTLTVQAHNTVVQPSDGLPLKEGSYLRIVFADEGIGIIKTNLSCIFDPYFTTKDMGSQKGMGLGLSVCYSVLKKHDGHITVTSRPGKGTTFTLYLPAMVGKAKGAIQ